MGLGNGNPRNHRAGGGKLGGVRESESERGTGGGI